MGRITLAQAAAWCGGQVEALRSGNIPEDQIDPEKHGRFFSYK